MRSSIKGQTTDIKEQRTKNKLSIIQGQTTETQIIESIRIGLASPERIKNWAERLLVSGMTVGRILNAQTVNYKTLRPVMGGLFCERIFGPIKDFECACERKSTAFCFFKFFNVPKTQGGLGPPWS